MGVSLFKTTLGELTKEKLNELPHTKKDDLVKKRTETDLYTLTQMDNRMTNFQEIGKTPTNMEEGHLIMTIDYATVNHPIDIVEQVCTFLEHQGNDTHISSDLGTDDLRSIQEDHRHCQIILQKMKQDRENTYELLLREQIHTTDQREKRFIGFLAGLLLGGAGGYMVSELSHLHDTSTLKSNQKHIIEILERQERNLTLENMKLNRMNQTLIQMIKEEVRLATREYIMNEAARYMDWAVWESQEHARTLRALNNLVTKKLDPNILQVDELRKALASLKKKAAEKLLTAPLERVSEVYSLPMNYLAKDNQIIIFIHVPLLEELEYLTVYRMNPSTVNLTENLHGMIIEEDYLAVSGDEKQFKIIRHEDLQRCINMKNHYFYCRDSILRMDYNSHCLSAMYKRNYTAASRLCQLRLLPDNPTATQISKTEFLLFHPKETTLYLADGYHVTAKERIKGTFHLKLTNGRAYTETYFLKGTEEVYATYEVEFEDSNWEISSLIKEVDVNKLENLVRNLAITEPIAVADLPNLYHLKNLDPTSPLDLINLWHLLHLPPYIGVILIFCLLIWVLCKACRKNRNQSSN